MSPGVQSSSKQKSYTVEMVLEVAISNWYPN